MNTPADPPRSKTAPRNLRLPWLLALFAGSGCAALIYEVVWFPMLQLIIGSSAVSLAVLLSAYMGGMGLGSLLLPRLIPARLHPLRVYAWIEVGIGACGLALLYVMPLLGRVYLTGAGAGRTGILLRGSVCAAGLLLPTILMGATLPAAARWVQASPRGAAWLGGLYGANTGGAVAGCLLAGFYLLRVHDMGVATYVAAGLNAAVALTAFALAAREPFPGSAATVSPAGEERRGPSLRAIHIVIGISGLTALGAEVIWTRLLGLILGGTVYAFSLILAVFLAGLGIGSGIGAVLARKKASPRTLLGVCQFLLAAGIAWTAYQLSGSLPYWPITPSLLQNPWIHFQLDLLRCLWAVLPPTLLWGASFPLALAAAVENDRDWGKGVGRVYAANTAGAIAGAIGFSLLLIPALGTADSQRLLIGLSLGAGILALAPRLRRLPAAAAAAAAGVAAAALALSLPGAPWELIAFGRQLPSKTGMVRLLYVGEGLNASVAVTELESGSRNFHVSGKIEASSVAQDMRLQRMLGHLPALLHPEPRSVLVVGCGAGVTAGTFVLSPEVRRVVICEIEPLIPQVVARFFGHENYDVLEDPRVEVVLDDARHYILTTQETFDVITTDPINPWVKGSATLYTREYYEMCRRRLNPGGIIAQWVPLYETTAEAVKSEFATFFGAFPGGTVWSNDYLGLGYDVILAGGDGAGRIDVDAMEDRLARDDHRPLLRSLEEVGFHSGVDLLARYAGRDRDLVDWLAGAAVNTDRNLRLQYLAGRGVNAYQSYAIFDDLMDSFRYPDDLFRGSEANLARLRRMLEAGETGEDGAPSR